ncbi:hypothetical protein Leryth_018008 [Lithospermum erythrorhizon]|nr:hypothetical protein Leryth_018008 [Lithospermum erythrorhizon]
MALNYSHRTIFPARVAEDNYGFTLERIRNLGIPEKSGEAFGRPHYVNREIEECFDYGRDRTDGSGSSECMSEDIIDLLPSDPFGMNISSTVTAITGWLEDFEMDYGGFVSSNAGRTSNGECDFFAGLNFIWNNAMLLQSFPDNVHLWEKSSSYIKALNQVEEVDFSDAFAYHANVDTSTPVMQIAENAEGSKCRSDGDDSGPHEALYFALGYLELKDILSVDSVCRSLHSTVRADPLLWRSIHIEQPMNEKVTDDILFQLTSRAQGNLQWLCLVECPRITDYGLRR